MAETCFVAKALVFDGEGRFLELRRSETHPRLAGLADLPGGKVESGEEPGHAVAREIKEETGLDVSPEQLEVLYATTMLLSGRSYPTLLYRAGLSESKPAVILSYEHGDYSWEPIEKLADIEPHIAPTYRQALQYLRENKIL